MAASSCLSASLASLGLKAEELDEETLELLGVEPKVSQMATRSKRMRWHQGPDGWGLWHWVDPIRRRWLAPPSSEERGQAALRKFGDRAGPIAGMDIRTYVKCLTPGSDVLGISLVALAAAGPKFAAAIDPSGLGLAEME